MSADIIVDTMVVTKMYYSTNVFEIIMNKIKEKCYSLVLPPIKSEIKGRLKLNSSEFPYVILPFMNILGNKFINKEKCDKKIKKMFQKAGLKEKDALVACVAVKRARKTGKAILVSDDPDFIEQHDAFMLLRKECVELKGFEDFYTFIVDC